jgi:predicted amidohydrolase YtcJ
MNPAKRVIAASFVAAVALSCAQQTTADLLLVNGRVYTLSWPDPDLEGQPAASAPHDANGWRPDADTVAIANGRIVFVGHRADAPGLAREGRSVDLKGATVIPGLVDSHVHLANLGAALERVNLVGVTTEADAVARVAERAASVPKREWIVGWGWDEGAWTSHLPDMRLLSERVPDHPVVLHGLHSFAVWGNRLAFDRAGITRDTPAPSGGEIKKDAAGNPTGVLLNNAGALLTNAVPAPSADQLRKRVEKALEAVAAHGYTSVHEAGADSSLLTVLQDLDRARRLLIPVEAMIAARDTALVDAWRTRQPTAGGGMLTVRSVKAFYDGAMGSRGAFFLAPYSDRPDHHGVGGAEYGFDRDRLAAMMTAGYQVTIHAIGDRANREALDFVESVLAKSPAARATRPRIEHAQVLSPIDVPRFAALGVIASMQPSHAVEDMAWAEARVGPERIKGAYAWRSLRRAGARLALNSDLPGTDYDIFYGLHSAVTRMDREGRPAGGWRHEEALTIEEAVRGWTSWAAYAGFREQQTGTIATGRKADLTVMDLDPFQTAESAPARLLGGRNVMTIANGRVVQQPAPN